MLPQYRLFKRHLTFIVIQFLRHLCGLNDLYIESDQVDFVRVSYI